MSLIRVPSSLVGLGLTFALAVCASACGSSGDPAASAAPPKEESPGTDPTGAVPPGEPPPDAASDAASPGDGGDAGKPAVPAKPKLPGGRPNFVASLMGAKYNGAWARVAEWTFSENGSVAEAYWSWDQTQAPAEHETYTHRARSGYRTVGCPNVCDVWTAKGFEAGATKRTGAWSFDANGEVRVAWPSGRNERYKIIDRGTYVELGLVQHDYAGVSTVYGAVFGSRAPLSTGATATNIMQAGQLTYELHEQNWNEATLSRTVTLPFDQYRQCKGSPCIQGSNPAGYHTYYAGDPVKDGRKTFWYHQLASVAQSTTCANIERTGHTAQLLQILDDNGKFVGWVGAEASLVERANGGSVISHIRMVKP